MEKLWDMVNSVTTMEDVARAEKILQENMSISNEEYNELMLALSYIAREL